MKVLVGTILLMILAIPLQALDGVDFYYGLGVEQDYRCALVEFQKEKDFHVDVIFQILMYLNGDGVPQDATKALELWRTKIDKAGWTDMTTIGLKRTIDDRLAHQASIFPHLSFEDIAVTTVDINEAANIRARIQENRQTRLFAEIESRLTEQELKSWSKLKKLVATISELDAERVFTEYIDGTIRTAYFFSIQHLILDNFLNRSTQWLLQKPTMIASESGFNEVDRNLNITYRALQQSLEEEYQEVVQMYADDPDSQEKYRRYMKEMATGLKNAQLAWIDYRDTWIELVLESYAGNDPESIKYYIKTEMTKDRIGELEFTKLE